MYNHRVIFEVPSAWVNRPPFRFYADGTWTEPAHNSFRKWKWDAASGKVIVASALTGDIWLTAPWDTQRAYEKYIEGLILKGCE
ncbi:MAG: hypothetical protein EHM12_09985 [Dehalococcoidia bacterium]|nr:MAG: hypothetical protein EHM12_09985 [Dehalococcoidia bacterium]